MYDTVGIMKQFVFDRLVDRENLCNLKKEKDQLLHYIENKDNVVVYAPRNFGKTSLLKNVVIEDFKKQHKKSFVFFADLMGVKSLNSIIGRLMNSFERSFNESFPVRNIIENIKTFLFMLKPEVSIDSITGNSSISLGISADKKEYSIFYIFQLLSGISKKIPVLIVIDEFQDIVSVDEAEALFRSIFQEMDNMPVILMGSKRHLLSDIFSLPSVPLYSWGVDIEIPPIPYNEYHVYMNERFSTKNIHIAYDEAVYLQNLLNRIPEPVNIVCQQIMDTYDNLEITKDMINNSLKQILNNRERRYETQIQGFSVSEEKILSELAKMETIEKPQSKTFIAKTDRTARTIGKIFEKLMQTGILEKTGTYYRISDPLFRFYLNYYR